MAMRGQRFELDLESDNFSANLLPPGESADVDGPELIKGIVERHPTEVPAAPQIKATKTGFPEHRKRDKLSAFKQRQAAQGGLSTTEALRATQPKSEVVPTQLPPSDAAIVHHVGKKYGYDFEAQQKTEISAENKRRIAEMTPEDIEEARAELMTNLHPAFLERLLRRANIDDEAQEQTVERRVDRTAERRPDVSQDERGKTVAESPTEESGEAQPEPTPLSNAPALHFPVPPRSASSFVPLDPDDPKFLEDLKTHYFPETPHDPSSLAWLQPPSAEENEDSLYNPAKDSYPTSSLRFSFVGKLIPPKESLEIDVSKGLHHHGLAPASAGYTIPELAILSRSTLPNQRCIAFQVLGRILFRLGRGDFGPRGSELQEGLWLVVEQERVIEILMREANREGGHVSAKAYATEALWLWRKGGGGDRGLRKEGEKIAK